MHTNVRKFCAFYLAIVQIVHLYLWRLNYTNYAFTIVCVRLIIHTFKIWFILFHNADVKSGINYEWLSIVYRSIDINIIGSIHNRHARTTDVPVDLATQIANNGSLNWIIVSVNVDIYHKSTHAVSERDEENTHPAQGVAARSQKHRAFIFCRVCHEPRHDDRSLLSLLSSLQR